MSKTDLSKILSNRKNLERILENLDVGIIAHDLNRKIFYFNEQAETITGYHRQEVLGKDCHEVFGAPLCGEQCTFCGIKDVVNDKTEYTINIATKNNGPRRVKMSVTTMKDENNQNFGVLAALTDMTEFLNLSIRARNISSFSGILGKDSKMLTVFQQIRDVAGYDYPVHISGETGTGKELVANAIHNESPRSGAPFVPINCGALPESLIESELFGHVKGAFSGAVRNKKGRFELADRGTIFLDEIADLSKPMQVKLLRFLQDGTFEKVGGEKTVSVSVRVLSATNKNLKKEVQQNNFRKDLFYRLNVIPIHLPPLRERRNDIPLLIQHFLDEAEEMHDRKPPKVSKEALSIMMGYHWPGNVRELQNVIQFAIVNCSGDTILPKDLPRELKEESILRTSPGASRKLNIEIVKSALEKTGGNKAKASRLLGVGRATLYRFLKDHPQTMPGGR
jgi:PAS domain S-box-containing protein